MRAVEERLNGAWWLLRLGLAASIFVAGLDKFFDRLAQWSMYLSPAAEKLLPVSGDAFLRAAGVVEMVIGVLVLTRWTRVGAYALAAWLLAIAANLALAGSFWDLVMRDAVNALAAYTLGRLTEWRAALAPRAAPLRPPAVQQPGAAKA
ncbi:DoxX family membrane protein [Anaeromyxobacter oryzae]|uniref:DoxX family protein n=1 Tax=Anaeromyxobacter oryzae TaxID=2918170 RepID=A0ABM7X4D7_9BACT|nr:DoxX family membrane protein [Anaeromyxobacter oryzae]BDG06675.1 hypothetical protein AMOR_56710 [Anaeromyxobacter oryzae]